MNIRDLRYFVALADHRHFGRAATTCFVSQPTLSTQIRKLEDELGVALVERAPRRVMLTPVGHDIATRARRILDEVDQLSEIARRTRDPRRRWAGNCSLPVPTACRTCAAHSRAVPRLNCCWWREDRDHPAPVVARGTVMRGVLGAVRACDQPAHGGVQAIPAPVPAGHSMPMRRDQHQGLANESLLLRKRHCLRDRRGDANWRAGEKSASARPPGDAATDGSRQRRITLLPTIAIKPPVPRSENIHLIDSASAAQREIAMVWSKSSAMKRFLKSWPACSARCRANCSSPTPMAARARAHRARNRNLPRARRARLFRVRAIRRGEVRDPLSWRRARSHRAPL